MAASIGARLQLKAARTAVSAASPHSFRRCYGTEFALHYRLTERLAVDTFFCEAHSPWQKGGVENAIGRLRRFLPRKTNLAELSPCQIARIVKAYNDTPRKCLDFKTPAEAFSILISNVALQS